MISSFTNEFAFLSNFHPAPVLYEGRVWPTTEHFYQAMKLANGPDLRVITAPTPAAAKKTGRQIALRPDWEVVKVKVMLFALRAKFLEPVLRKRLMQTAPQRLVEGNHWHDNYWGDCSCAKCAEIPGKNMLGILLMVVRSEVLTLPDHMW